jgi:hypothetical protein
MTIRLVRDPRLSGEDVLAREDLLPAEGAGAVAAVIGVPP